jgi:hypothetical protein
MTTHEELREICRKLPGATEGGPPFSYGVDVKGKHRGFIWTWNERVHPKKPKEPNERVLAIRTPNLQAKELLLASDPERFFTEYHYNGYPAILVRLDVASPEDLVDLIEEAYRTVVEKSKPSRKPRSTGTA